MYWCGISTRSINIWSLKNDSLQSVSPGTFPPAASYTKMKPKEESAFPKAIRQRKQHQKLQPDDISESATIVCDVLSQQELTLYPNMKFLAVQTSQELRSKGDLIKNVISRVKPLKWEHCSLCSAAKVLVWRPCGTNENVQKGCILQSNEPFNLAKFAPRKHCITLN